MGDSLEKIKINNCILRENKMVTIFIVEDDPNVQKIYEKVLRHSSSHIIGIANNGEEAIKIFKY